MIIRLSLHKLTARLALLFVSLPVLAFLVWLTVSHFIIGVMADPREEIAPDLLSAATGYFPDSPLLNARMAGAELAETNDPEAAIGRAEMLAGRAVRLSPRDYQNWILLASALEAKGEIAGALNAIQTAIQLAPKYTEGHWQHANLLLRNGQTDQALAEFQTAVSLDPARLGATLDLIFNATDGDLASLETVAGNGANERLGLARFLLDHSLADDAVRIFSSVNRQARLNSPDTEQFFNSLIASGRFGQARNLWAELITQDKEIPLIWNGGFESDAVSHLGQFDWVIRESEFASFAIVSGMGRNSARSLRIDFAGRDTTRLLDEVRQTVILKPGAHYRLECYVRTAGLETPAGPRVVIASGAAEIATSAPIASGNQDWTPLTIEFTVPTDSAAVFIGLRRIPKFSYDDPTRGTIWFDDFRLTPLEPGGETARRRKAD